jgi:oligopeptide/dipeptide ABC transporter ATP-binding protein
VSLSAPRPASAAPLLSVRDLTVSLFVAGRWRPAVDRVWFDLAAGECLAVVGESGCGKTMLARAVAGLPPEGARVSGEVVLEGEPVVAGRGVGLVLQDPSASLDPVRTIGAQILEGLRAGGRPASRGEARDLLAALALTDPDRILSEHPHRLSGGEKQRACLAAALATRPRLLVLDEPTTALDPTVAAELARELLSLRRAAGLGILWVTHDLALAASVADTLLVLYAGRAAERGEAKALLSQPQHPYTRALLASVPRGAPAWRGERLAAIAGALPDLSEREAQGCPFAPRCPERFDPCAERHPPEYARPGGSVACFLFETRNSELGTRDSGSHRP